MLGPIPVKEVMVAPVETIDPEASARTAATRLFEAGIGSLVVTDAEEPIGIVTDCDVTRLVSSAGDPETTTVREFMSSPVISTGPDTPIEAAAGTMRDHEIKRLPVIENGTLVGILTTTDLSNYLPHIVRVGRGDRPTPDRVRRDVRVDTAYEREEWSFEYRGNEAAIDVGDIVRFTKELSTADVEAFAEASGDTNRLHLDDGYAAGTRFGERIAHGTLVVGVVSAALARLPGLIVYLSQDVSYLGPVTLGTEVTAECEVVEDLGRGRFRLATTVDTDEDRVIDGEAVVMADPIPDSA